MDDIQHVAAGIASDANLISLKPVIIAVNTGKTIVGDIENVRTQLKGDPATLNVAALNQNLADIVQDLQGVFKSIEDIKPRAGT